MGRLVIDLLLELYNLHTYCEKVAMVEHISQHCHIEKATVRALPGIDLGHRYFEQVEYAVTFPAFAPVSQEHFLLYQELTITVQNVCQFYPLSYQPLVDFCHYSFLGSTTVSEIYLLYHIATMAIIWLNTIPYDIGFVVPTPRRH